jgi:diguanylate cyclase (GGDEF)-like protein/PAS domain S-box-containing protein
VSLFTRIFIFLALTLLLVAGGELFNGLRLRQERLAEARHDSMELARVAELDIDRILEGAHQLLATLAKLPADRGWDERACSVLEATANGDFEYDHLVAVDRSGNNLCGSTRTMPIGTPMPDRELFDRIVARAGFAVGSYGMGRTSGNEVIRVGYPVVDAAGAVVGAVYAGINVTWLNTAVAQWQLGTAQSIDITDQNGIVIARHPDPRGVGQPIQDDLKPLVSAAHSGTAEVMGPDGVMRLYGYVPSSARAAEHLAVFVGRDRAKVVANIDRSIWLNAATVLIGFILAAAVAAIRVRRVLALSLQKLLTAAGRWRDGDWSVRAGAASGIPEFDSLSLAFNEMASEVATQIRAREIAQQSRLAALERFRLIFDSVSDAILVIDPDAGTFIDVNNAGCTMFGFSRDELICYSIDDLSSGIAPYTHADAIIQLSKGQIAPFEWHCKAKDGHLFWVEVSQRGALLEDRPVGLAILRDTTERKRLNEEVVHQAHFDSLTGLPNRLDFDAALDRELARCRRYGRPLCMAIADIDHFKVVNDTFGHHVGDTVLKTLAAFLREGLRGTDYIARWGGEEFTILLPETELADAEALLDRLRAGVAGHLIPEIGRAVTLSFGVTAYMHSDDSESLLQRVDEALYVAKDTGRNLVTRAGVAINQDRVTRPFVDSDQ